MRAEGKQVYSPQAYVNGNSSQRLSCVGMQQRPRPVDHLSNLCYWLDRTDLVARRLDTHECGPLIDEVDQSGKVQKPILGNRYHLEDIPVIPEPPAGFEHALMLNPRS